MNPFTRGRKAPRHRRGAVSSRRHVLWLGPPSAVAQAEIERLSALGYDMRTSWCVDDRRVPSGDLQGVDALIVADDMALLADMLHDFRGRIIGRYYGELEGLMPQVWNGSAYSLVEDNPAVHFAVALNTSALAAEQGALLSRSSFVPPLVTPGLAGLANGWIGGQSTVVVPSPVPSASVEMQRLSDYVGRYFSDDPFSVMFVSHRATTSLIDEGVTEGTESAQLLATAAGMLNPFSMPGFIPRIILDMLLIGGPIIYFAGSALDHLIGNAPGRVATIDAALALAARLGQGERELARTMITAQAPARNRYAKAKAQTIFEHEMPAILDGHRDVTLARARSGSDVPEVRQAFRLAHDIVEALDPTVLDDEDRRTRLVETAYHCLLQREPDEDGLRAFVGRLGHERRYDRILLELLHSEENYNLGERNRFLAWLRD